MMVGNSREVGISCVVKEMPDRAKAQACQTYFFSFQGAFRLGSLVSGSHSYPLVS